MSYSISVDDRNKLLLSKEEYVIMIALRLNMSNIKSNQLLMLEYLGS